MLFFHINTSFSSAGVYACKLPGDEAVEDLTGLMGVFHPSPIRRNIQFRLSMNICEICVVIFWNVSGKAL